MDTGINTIEMLDGSIEDLKLALSYLAEGDISGTERCIRREKTMLTLLNNYLKAEKRAGEHVG